MNHSIMISMRCQESLEYGLPPGTGYVKLCTYDREHGRSADFLLSSEALEKLNNASEETYASDAYSFMMVTQAAGWVRFCVTWLTGSEKSVAGHIQRFDIPLDGIQRMLKHFGDGLVMRFLYQRKPPRTKIITADAQASIRNACRDKRTRRALSKLMRDSLNWLHDTVYLHDGENGIIRFSTGEPFEESGSLVPVISDGRVEYRLVIDE